MVKYLVKIISTSSESSDELCRRFIACINASKSQVSSTTRRLSESVNSVVWGTDTADSLKAFVNFLEEISDITFKTPALLNPTITLFGLPSWITKNEIESSLKNSLHCTDSIFVFNHKANFINSLKRDWLIQISSSVFPSISQSKTLKLPFGKF